MDDLSPFFESRDTRVNRLPETVRNTFSVAEQEATKAGDTQFADKQFSSLWLSKRLGLPKKQVADNFDAIAGRFFGPGVTPSGAYDQISKTFEFAGGEGEGTDGTQTPTEEYSPVGGMPKAPANTFLYKAEQAARSIPSGAAKIGYMGLAAAHSQEASFIGGPTMPQAPDPMSDGEYATLARRNKEMEDPYQFSSVRDEEGSYFNPAAYDPQLEANEKRMRGIRTRLDKEHIVNMRAWSKATEDFESENPERAEKAKQVRKNSDTLYEMAEEMNHYYGIDPEFAETTLGKFAQMAGGVPATAVLGMMGPGGLAAMESVFFGEAEMDQKRAIEEQGGTYDPQQGVATNLASAVPQMILERYVGIEKVLASAMKATAKVGGKVMFGDYLKNVGKRVVESSIGEAWTEPAQGAWGDMIASLTYDEKRMIITGDAAERRLFEMVAGATMGALFGGPIAIAESMDSAAATKAEGAMVVAKDGNPLTGPEFNALRKIKSDEELMASAPDAESGKLLVAAVNGDVVAQREYNKKLINEQFTATEGMEAAGMTLGNVKGVPVLKDKEGNIFAINLSNQEHVQFLERFKAQVSKKAAQEVANELTKRFDDETKVIEFEEEERTMGDFIDAGLADIKKAEERMKIAIENGANIPEGTNPRDMVVLGNNITEYRNNVETDVSKIWRGGNAFTVIEEVSEGYVKKRLKIGDLSLDELQSWRTEYDAKAGIAPGTNSKQGLVEWFSARVVDYAVSNRKADNMPKSWGGFLRMLGDHLRQVMKMAAKMTKMQRDGKLNTELEQALKGALGLTPKAEAVAAAVDRGRAKKQAELEEVFAMIKPEAAERESLENYQRLKHKLSREEELTAIMLQRAQAEIEPVYGITAEISVQAQRILDEEGYGDVSFSVAPATNSVAFKKWFGDSKVVDADGKPKVVVHGNVFSADGGISSFDVSEQRFGKAGYGFYFSDITGANLFTEYGQRFQSNQSYRGEPNQPKSIPVYLSIKNPLVVDHVDDLARYIEKGQTFGAARGFSGNISPTAKLDLQRQGYDGIITRETTAKKVHKTQGLKILDRDDPKAISFPVYVAFEPTQIKSATGNRGTYDPVDPDITFSVGSPAFNKWFGDSKVVNDAGKPKVVYHGSTQLGFTEFDTDGKGKTARTGAFFTDDLFTAKTYSGRSGVEDPPSLEKIRKDPERHGIEVEFDERYDIWIATNPDGETFEGSSREDALDEAVDNLQPEAFSGVYEVYLALKDPIIIDAKGQNWDDISEGFDLFDEDGDTFDTVYTESEAQAAVDEGKASKFTRSWGKSTDSWARDARDMEADGLIIHNVSDGGPDSTGGEEGTIYVVFEPAQIKSATGNRGTYDPVDPDITFSVGSPAFNKWFGDSKVVNDAGKPKVVYHGTSSSFAEFNKSRQGDGPSSSQFEGREGFFFTTNPLEAEDSAFEAGIWDARANARENIVPVYLRITNPYVRKSGGKWPQSFYDQSWQDIQDKAKRGGHDGIVVTGTGKAAGTSMFVVFEPTQIKSATGNRGTYDPANPDITFSVGDSDGQPDGTGAQRTPRYDKGTTGDSQPANARRTTGDTGTDGAERYGSGVLTPLEGAPAIEGATGPDLNLVSVVEEYAKSLGLPLHRQAEFVHVDKDRAAKIAQAYDKMKHAPGDPVVAEAYQNLITQTAAQYRALEAAGYEFYLVDDSNDPYAGNPWNAMRDLRANKRMAVYATEAGFGSDESTTVDTSENPLLSDTGITWRFGKDGPMKRVLANDLFRAVHDAFGHGIEGAGFRARGEENAWQAHVRLFRGSAVGALTSETRGQNSWLNFGPHGETNKTAKVFDTVFAEQKTGLMPEWTWLDGRAGNAGDHINPRESVDPDVADTSFSLRVTVAPVRVDTVPKLTKAELLKRSGSAKFIHLQQIFDDVAAAYGVKITARFPVIGGWTERGKVSLEVPEVVEFDTDDMEIGAEMAGLVAASAPELQNSALVWQDDENGPDQIITFTVANDAAATAIAKDWNRGKVPAFSYDVANRRFTLVLKSPDDEMHGHVEAFIKKATKKGSISVGEIPTQGQGRAEFPSDERGRYESIAGEARVRASKLPAGQQQEALNEVVSRAERRIKKQAAAAKVARKAKKVLKSLPVPPESAAKIDQELGSIKFDTIRDYGLWLDARFKENTEVGAYEVGSQEGITNGGTTLAYDIIDGLSTDGSGMGWYDERVQETFRELMKIFPEFSEDPNAMTVFIGALAATSQGNNVILNFKYARKVYESYKKNGVLPTDTKFAAAKKPINDNLATMNSIIAEYGLDGFREFMDKEVTGGQLKEMFGAAPDGVTLSEIVRGNRVLGPKIGSFFNNLRGRFDTITMDLWYTRTMHRYVGESVLPLDTPKSKKMVAAFRAELNKPGTRTYGLDMKEANRGGEHTVRAAVKLFTRWSQKNEYAKKGYAKFADGYAIEKAARTIQIHASMKAAPQNKTERGWFEAIVLNAQQKLKDLGFKLTVADMQAIVWYREKNLFLDHGVAKGAAKPADYLDGAMVSRRDAEDQLDDMEEELSDNEDSTFSLVSKEDVVFGLTGVPQNEEQSLQADAEKIRSKAQDATAELVRRIRMGETLPTRVKRAKRTAESSMAARLLIPITGRLHRFAPTLAARLRRFEFDTGRAIKADFDKIKPFVDAFAKLGQNEALILDLALKNGDTQTRDQILQAFDLREAYAEVQAVLADTRKRGLAAGYEIGELTDYFPRKVMDLDGLRAHYYGKPEGGVVDRAVKEASKKAALMGRVLTDEERMEVVNRTLQGLGRKGSIPGNFKGRKTDVVDVDANAFYADSIQALLGYIDSTNAAIEKRRFFGNYAVDTPTISGVKSSKKLALDASIGGLVDSLVSSGELDGQSQREVIAILEGRFNQGITSGVIKMFKTIGYITTMGQVTSALTQLGDLAFSIYESGVWDTAIAAGTAVAGKSKVTKETMGIENIAEEFRDKTKMNRALEMTFKLTGLSYIDRIGKETLVNAKLRSMQREAKKGKLSPKTIARINTSFGEAQGAQVVADLAAGKESSDVLFAVYSTLADYQPISLSEYPESYLTNPNGRVFYMLKTFTLKQLEAFRREGIDMMVTGNASQKAQGMANLIRLMGVLYLINVPVDWLKDWLMGRDPQLSDLMVDNLFKLSGVSRWHLWNFRYRQNPIESVALLALPPAPFIQFPVMDLFDSWSKIEDGDEIKPGDFDFWRILPFAGSPYYWHFGAGADKIQKRREEREGSKRNR